MSENTFAQHYRRNSTYDYAAWDSIGTMQSSLSNLLTVCVLTGDIAIVSQFVEPRSHEITLRTLYRQTWPNADKLCTKNLLKQLIKYRVTTLHKLST